MYGDPQTFIFITLFAVAVYWALPASQPALRAATIFVASSVLIFSASPLALLAVFVLTVTGYAGMRIALAQRSKALAWASVALLTLEYIGFQHLSALRSEATSYFLVLLGLSYVYFRTIAVVLDFNQYRRSPEGAPSLVDVLLLNVFYPIVPSGPIERLENLRFKKLTAAFNFDLLLYGVMRAIVGLFMVTYIGDAVILPRMQSMEAIYFTGGPGGTVWGAYAFCVVSLLFLYVNFAGFMNIALGVGAMFGFRLSENFRWPFLATNIQDFWKRWHVTLGEFATKYIYFPLLKIFRGNPYASIFATFILVGIWHEISWTFFVWGTAHGAALALHSWLAPKNLFEHCSAPTKLVLQALNWVVTMFFVCWAWTFASAPSLEAAVRMTGFLIGIGE